APTPRPPIPPPRASRPTADPRARRPRLLPPARRQPHRLLRRLPWPARATTATRTTRPTTTTDAPRAQARQVEPAGSDELRRATPSQDEAGPPGPPRSLPWSGRGGA